MVKSWGGFLILGLAEAEFIHHLKDVVLDVIEIDQLHLVRRIDEPVVECLAQILVGAFDDDRVGALVDANELARALAHTRAAGDISRRRT